ncbi:MAG: signal peptidase II [Burkholderiaceae bacterium]|jgi:signal peptidase II
MFEHKQKNSFGIWLLMATMLVVIDQFTKALIMSEFTTGSGVVVTDFFNIVRVHNYGAAFSFLATEGGWQRWLFTGIALATVVWIVWMLKTQGGQTLFAFALSCILGGAVGNVLDRIMHGYVVDFLDFHWDWLTPVFYKGHFPSFNVADIAISVGAIALIVDELIRVSRSKTNSK